MLFATVSAFEKGDHVATLEQSEKLLRLAFANLQGLRGGSYEVKVLAANETFNDEDLYEELDEIKSSNSSHVERHAQSTSTTTKQRDRLLNMMLHMLMPYHLCLL